MTRASLTAGEKKALIRAQAYCCAMCGHVLFSEAGEPVEFDHWIPVALGNGGKPDSAMHPSCHARKTRRDVAAIAKAKRLAGETGQNRRKRPILSRPFDKRFRKRMDGTVERRT